MLLTINDFCAILGLSILEVRKINTINDRIIKIIDEDCGGNRSEFARRLEITPTYAAQLYKGERIPGDRIISSIRREFNVRREWLENGEGPMRLPEPDIDTDIINDLLADTDDPVAAGIKAIYKVYKELPDEDQEVLRRFIKSILDSRK